MEVLARIVPGCERLVQTGENEYEGTVKIGVQSIKGSYSGRIRLEDIQPPHHYKLVASGRSSNGVVDGAGTVDLAEQDGNTVLTYGGDAQIGGTLASVGQRLIEGASKQMINQSLKALAEQIAARARGDAAGGSESHSADAPAGAQNGGRAVAAQAPASAQNGASAVAAEPAATPAPLAEPERPAGAPAPAEAAYPSPAPLPSYERRTVVV